MFQRLLVRAPRVGRQPRATRLEDPFPLGRHEFTARVDERRQRGLRVGGNRQVGFDVAARVLVVALRQQIARRDRGDLRAGLVARRRLHAHPVRGRERVQVHEELGMLDAQNHVGIGHGHGGIHPERVAAREVHAQREAHVLHGRLQQLRQLHEQRQALRRARHATGDDSRILCGHQHARQFCDGAGIADRRAGRRQAGHAKPRPLTGRDRLFLHRGIGHDHDRSVRGRRGELVRPHGGLAKVRERRRRVVPLGVIAHHGRSVLHGVRPFDVAAPELHVEDVPDHDVDGHAVGVGVVDRHRRMLQAHGAVGHHHHRRAVNFGVAVGHGYRRLFVAAREQLGLGVAAVVDERLVQRAER